MRPRSGLGVDSERPGERPSPATCATGLPLATWRTCLWRVVRHMAHCTRMEPTRTAPPDVTRRTAITDLPRGSTLRDLENAGVAVIPVHHERKANAADVLGIGRALSFQMAADGRLPVIRLGRRVVVSVAQLRAMLDGPGAVS
jgi:hypothetical protein